MRIRGYDEETEEYIGDVEELSGKIADLTKTASKPGGISLFTDANKTTYKSTYQLLKEIAEIYDDLTDKQQAGLLEALAGKRQGQIVAATIKNFDAAEEALRNMANSAGNAEAEMEVIRDSAEYAMNEFKETFTSLAQNSVSRNGLKGLIKAGTNILGIVNNIVEKIGLIPAILTTIVGITASKNITNGGFFGLGYDVTTGKSSLNFLGAKVGRGWTENYKAQKADMMSAKQTLSTLYAEMRNGNVESAAFKKAFTAAMSSGSDAVRGFAEKAKAGTATVTDFNAAMGSVSKSAKLAAVGVKVLNTAVSMLISMGISWAINKIIEVIDNAVHSMENHLSKLEELSGEISSLESEIKNINSELSTTKLKISDLEKLPKLTFLQKEELEELKRYNDELERQKKIAEAKAEADKVERNEEAKKTFGDMSGGGAPGTNFVNWLQGNTIGRQVAEIEKYKRVLDAIDEIKNYEEYEQHPEWYEEQLSEFEAGLDDVKSNILGAYGTWNKLIADLDPDDPQNKEAIALLQSLIDEWEILSGKIENTFKGVYNAPQFATVKKYLDDLAEKGELTVEKYNSLTEKDVEGIDRFRKACENVKDLTVEGVVESIVEEVKDLDDGAGNAKNSVLDIADAFDKLTGAIDEAADKQEKLVDAFKKTRLGLSLTIDEVYELLKTMPELAQYLSPTEDGGFTISDEGFKALSDANRENIAKTTKEQAEQIKDEIELLEKKAELERQIEEEKKRLELQNAIDGFNASKDDSQNAPFGRDYSMWNGADITSEKLEELQKQYEETAKSCQDINETTEELQAQYEAYGYILQFVNEEFDAHKAKIDGLNEAYEIAEEQIEDYNKEISTIDSAIKKLNEGSSLTYEEMNSLIAISPILEDSFKDQDGEYTIIIDLLKELREQSLKTRNDYIDDRLVEAKAQHDAAEETIKSVRAMIANVSAMGTGGAAGVSAALAELNEKLADAVEQSEVTSEIINMLEGWQRGVPSGDSSSDLSKELQNQIDYYKNILDAIGIVKDKYSESIDDEIKALEDGKDALKDANDERQRELDLIEARNNLENAKKRKVYVYTEGEGFKQVQDKAAVKEAEEEYRDAITDIQEAEIDKAIDELEKQKEALEENTKALTELEQNIQDAITVNKAMDALGLTDQSELLNLPDDVKQSIVDGFVDAMVKKDNEDNKNNNSK
ncbi:MAG: hypothetical protein NC401_16050, partial [Ruminococcus sp.]|nr:hypothetical protein [Ruminococcus sp.]